MKVIHVENGGINKGIVLVVSPTEPTSANITGADVDGLPDDFVLAAGSVIVTPSANYIAFEDGIFTAKGSGGGGGGSETSNIVGTGVVGSMII